VFITPQLLLPGERLTALPLSTVLPGVGTCPSPPQQTIYLAIEAVVGWPMQEGYFSYSQIRGILMIAY
jgi:hypothetical protein